MDQPSPTTESPFPQLMRSYATNQGSGGTAPVRSGPNGGPGLAMGRGHERDEILDGADQSGRELNRIASFPEAVFFVGQLDPFMLELAAQREVASLTEQMRARAHPFFGSQAALFQEEYELQKELGDREAFAWLKVNLGRLRAVAATTPSQLVGFGEFGTARKVASDRDMSLPVIMREEKFYLERTRWIPVRAATGAAQESSAHVGQVPEKFFKFEARGFTVAALREYVDSLQQHWDEKKHPDACSVIDDILMQDLVDFENDQNPAINIHYLADAAFFGAALKKLFPFDQRGALEEKVARFLIRTGDQIEYRVRPCEIPRYVMVNQYHFCAIEVRRLGGKLSVLAMESTGPNAPQCISTIYAKLLRSLREIEVESKLLFGALDVQKSNDECGIFALSFLRKSYSQNTAFTLLHERNLNGFFDQIASDQLSDSFPPEVMKHASSRERLKQYIISNPIVKDALIHKRKYTLEQYGDINRRIQVVLGDAVYYNASIERKRLKIIECFYAEVDRREALRFNSKKLTSDVMISPEYLSSMDALHFAQDFRIMRTFLGLLQASREKELLLDTYTVVELRKRRGLLENQFAEVAEGLFSQANARYRASSFAVSQEPGFLFTSQGLAVLEQQRLGLRKLIDAEVFGFFKRLCGPDEVLEDEGEFGEVSDVRREPSRAVVELLGISRVMLVAGSTNALGMTKVRFDGQRSDVELPTAPLVFWGEYLFRSNAHQVRLEPSAFVGVLPA